MSVIRLLVPLGLVLVVFVWNASAMLNPCCPNSPYNGEQTKMHMIWALRDMGGYTRFLTALNDSRKCAESLEPCRVRFLSAITVSMFLAAALGDGYSRTHERSSSKSG